VTVYTDCKIGFGKSCAVLDLQKPIHTIQDPYKNVKCWVIHNNNLIEPIWVKTGVKQGTILPPILFSLTIYWKTTRLIHTKIKIFRTNVLSELLYGSECWKTTPAIERKLEVFQNNVIEYPKELNY
jgi:hypothetical protein